MTVILSFNEETEKYVRLLCTRKGILLEDYILDNFEWDDKPDCISPEILIKVPKGMCYECQWNDRCPDAISVRGCP